MKYKTRKVIENENRSYSHAIDTKLLSKKNVNSFYVSKKIIDNKETNIKCLTVGVSKKEKKENLNEKDLIPNFYEGLPTDVIETEIPNAHDLSEANFCGEDCGAYCKPSIKYPYGCNDQQYASDGEYYNCIPGGVSIGINGSGSGTLGFNGTNSSGKPIGLTNNHVLGSLFYHPSVEKTITFEVSYIGNGWQFKLLNRTSDLIHSISHDLLKKWIADHRDSENEFLLSDTGMIFNNPTFNGFDSPMLEGNRHYQFINKSEVPADFSFRYDYLNEASYNEALDEFFASDAMGADYPDPIDYKQITSNLRIYENTLGFQKRIYDQFGYTHYGQSTRVVPAAFPGETYDVIFDFGNFSHSRVHYYSYNMEADPSKPNGSNFVDVLFFGRGCTPQAKDREGNPLGFNKLGKRHAFYPSQNDSENPAGASFNISATPTSTSILDIGKGKKLIGSAYLYPMYAGSSINERSWNHGLQPSNVLDIGSVRYQHRIPLPQIVGIPDYDPQVFTSAWDGMPVIKSGRTTGVTSNAFITSTNWTGYINYCDNSSVIMTDCLKYETNNQTYFTDSGDSGAAVLSDVTKGVTAINFAGASGNFPERGGHLYRGFGIKIENIVDIYGAYPFNNSLIFEASNIVDEVGNLRDVEVIGHCGVTYKKEASESVTIIPPRWYIGSTPTPTPTHTHINAYANTSERSLEAAYTPTPTITPPTGTFTSTPTVTPPTGTTTSTPTATLLDTIH